MKRKIYFKTSAFSLIVQAIIVIFLLLDIFLAVFFTFGVLTFNFKFDFEKQVATVFVVIFYAGIIPLTYLELTFLLGNIVLGKNKIYTHGDFKIGHKTQYPVEMEYEDIKRVTYISLRRDSRGGYKRSLKPLPYILVEGRNGRQVLFSLRLMSVKTVDHLLTALSNQSSGIAINVNQLVKEFKNYKKIYK